MPNGWRNRWWAGRDHVALLEPALSSENCLLTPRCNHLGARVRKIRVDISDCRAAFDAKARLSKGPENQLPVRLHKLLDLRDQTFLSQFGHCILPISELYFRSSFRPPE